MEKGMTGPFEDENATYDVLVNDEGQHSLWPSILDIPKGWSVIFKADNRAAGLEFIRKNWTDMRPNSLIKSMKGASAAGSGGDDSVDGPLAPAVGDRSGL